jgi:hypothetical protein
MESDKFLRPVLRRRRLSTFTGVEFLLSLCLSFALFACSDMALDEDAAMPKTDKGLVTTPGFAPGPKLGGTVSLQKVDLYLNKGSGATGILTVTIRTMAGVFVDSINVSAASLTNGSAWRTFYFPTRAHLQIGQRYQIRVLRSDRTNISRNDYIFMYTSSRLRGDVYPAGTNDLARDTWAADYAFQTYGGVEPDQRQLTTVSAFPVSNDAYRWQEFVVGEPRVNLTSLQLYFRFGPSVGSDVLHVRIRGTWDAASSDSVRYETTIPISQLQNLAWNEIPIQASLLPGIRYSITVGRRGTHHPSTGQYFYWSRSDGAADLYPDGDCSIPSRLGGPSDCAFRTYTRNGLDQSQENVADTARVAYGNWVGQSFTPRR